MQRTRIVHWLRVILPLIALAILSTMFLFSGRGGEEPVIPFAEADAEKLAGEELITAPEYSGVTSDGSALTLRANKVNPSNSGGGASKVRLDVENRDGQRAELTAPEVAIKENLITMSGGVNMMTSSGWSINANQIDAATDHSKLSTSEGIDAQAPFGKITAGKMNISRADPKSQNEEPGEVMNFTDGVRLIYSP